MKIHCSEFLGMNGGPCPSHVHHGSAARGKCHTCEKSTSSVTLPPSVTMSRFGLASSFSVKSTAISSFEGRIRVISTVDQHRWMNAHRRSATSAPLGRPFRDRMYGLRFARTVMVGNLASQNLSVVSHTLDCAVRTGMRAPQHR
jgi:hypothetical protein